MFSPNVLDYTIACGNPCPASKGEEMYSMYILVGYKMHLEDQDAPRSSMHRGSSQLEGGATPPTRPSPLWGDKVKGCGGKIEPLGFTIIVRGSGTSLPTPSHALGEHEQAVFVEDKAQQDGEDPREEQGLPARVLVAGDGRSREELARIQRE